MLDECHHLASLWGYIVREAIEELGDVHLVGLTATPPDALTTQENELYGSLLGPVDFTVPTPPLVRERALAPYQELAWLTPPLDAETGWLTEHDLRFQELITTLHEDQGDVVSMPGLGDRPDAGPLPGRGGGGRGVLDRVPAPSPGPGPRGREVPRLGRPRAAARRAARRGLPGAAGSRRLAGAAGGLRAALAWPPNPSGPPRARYAGIAAALRSLGFTLTRQGIRRGASDVDRLLMNWRPSRPHWSTWSAASSTRAGSGYAPWCWPTPSWPVSRRGRCAGVLRPEAGSAPEAVRALAADARTAVLRPLLVSGRGLRCAEQDADALLAALAGAGGSGGTGGTPPGPGAL